MELIEVELSITSPIGGTLNLTRCHPNLELKIGPLKLLSTNLSVMPMKDVDVIIRVDWLAES